MHDTKYRSETNFSTALVANECERGLYPELENSKGNLDQGQTAILLINIANSSYANSTLYSDLQSAALLSDDVLAAIWGRYPTFTQNQIFSLLIANSPVSPAMWKTIVGECNKLGYDYDTLAYAQAFNTVRTVQRIKWDMQAANTDWHQSAKDLMNYFAFADTTEEMHDSLFAYLRDTLGTKTFKKIAIGYGLEIGRVGDSRTVLNSLDLEDGADTSFYNYYDLAVSLSEDSLTWFGMDSAQKAQIHAISETAYDEATLAQAVVSLTEDWEYNRVPEKAVVEEERLAEMNSTTPQTQQASNTKQVMVYPNPFENSFNISYSLDKEGDLSIEVFDVMGRAIRKENLQNVQSGSIVFNLNECLGVYFVRVSSGSKKLFNGKMICINR